jgi:hypothetical protein
VRRGTCTRLVCDTSLQWVSGSGESMRGCRATCRILVCCAAIAAMVVPARAGAEPHRCTFLIVPRQRELRPVHNGQWTVDGHNPTSYGGLYAVVYRQPGEQGCRC